jgi:hypothetical protein
MELERKEFDAVTEIFFLENKDLVNYKFILN